MTWLKALLLGIVEGLTEFVPVSSTGHLILAKKALHLQGDGVDSFLLVIQLGALIAAIVYYRNLLIKLAKGVMAGNPEARRLFWALCLASLPLLAGGYLFGSRIKQVLFAPKTVAIAMMAGGVLMILADLWHQKREDVFPLKNLSPFKGLLIGLFQMFALIPGTSRSMSAIVGGQVVGLDRVSVADFAFLLAIPTLGTATVYELIKYRHTLLRDVGISSLLVGLATSCVVGFLVITGFLRYLRRYGLVPFGIYRILLGALVLFL